MRSLCFLSILLLSLSLQALGGVTGSIMGTVTDRDGSPLVGATVLLEETPYGTVTDSNGDYCVSMLTPGEYTVTARMVGTSEVRKEGVTVLADQSTKVDFSLSWEVTGSTVITVNDHRNLILEDVPSTIYEIDRSEIVTMPVVGILDVVSRQPGVVSRDGVLHIRGGRPGEVSFLLDGIPMQSPVSNSYNSSIPLSALSRTSITTGGFTAEYGNAMSGVVNMVTRDGGNRYEGQVTVRGGEMTEFGFQNISRNYMEPSENDNYRGNMINVEMSAGGPEPITTILLPSLGISIPGETRFFAAASYIRSGRNLMDSRGFWENNWQNGITASGKMTYRPTGRTRFSILGYYTWRNSGLDEWAWSKYNQAEYILGELYLGDDPDYAIPINYQENAGATFSLVHSFSDRTFMDIRLNQNRTCYWQRVKDRDGGYVGEGFRPNEWYVFFQAQPRVTDQLGFYHSGIHPEVWLDSRSTVSNAKLDVTSQLTREVQVKTGIEARYYDIYDYSVYVEDRGSVYTSLWRAYPFSGALFLQGKLESQGGLVLNAGMRLDMFDANTNYYDADQGGSSEVSAKYQLSPRIGITHPVTDRDVFFSTYGIYFQMPSLNHLFYGTDYTESGSTDLIGNPDLEAQRTVAYDAGLRHRFSDLMSVSLSIFNKDVTGLVRTADYTTETATDIFVYENDDSHGTMRGLEMKFLRLPGALLSGSFSYTYSIFKGRYSSSTQQSQYESQEITFPPSEVNYLDWDQRHTADAVLNLCYGQGEGPDLHGLRILEGTKLILSWKWGSGFPYSPPQNASQQPVVNTERYPFTMQTDLALTRSLWPGSMEIELGVTVYNLFNRRNIDRIFDTGYYMDTGEPGGVIGNPGAWSPARHAMFTARVRF